MRKRTQWPRAVRFPKAEQDAVLSMFDSASSAEIAAYIERETAAIRLTWDEHDERRRRDGREEYVEIQEFSTVSSRRNVGRCEY